MEPVGLAASILGLIKATRTTRGWLHAFRDAPECFQNLRVDVDSFDNHVKKIKRVLDDEKTRDKISSERTEPLIDRATRVVRRLDGNLEKIQREGRGDLSRLQWLFKRSECRALQEDMNRLANALDRILIAAMFDHIRLIEQSHVVLRSQNPRLLEYNSLILEDTRGEADVMISQASFGEPYSSTHSHLSVDSPSLLSPPLLPRNSEANARSSVSSGDSSTLVEVASRRSSSPIALHLLCKEPCSCDCHANAKALPEELRSRSSRSPNIFVQYLRRCSLGTCRAKRLRPSRGFVIPSSVFRRAVSMSLISRSYHILIHLKCARIVPESSDSIFFAATGNLRGMERLLATGQARICERSDDNWTLLHNAGYYGSPAMVKLLIKKGADIKVGEIGGRKPAHLARIRALSVDATNFERERAEAFPNWEDYKDDFNLTPIHVAVLQIYDSDDKDCPSIERLLDFVDHANDAEGGQDWSAWRKSQHKMCLHSAKSHLFLDIVAAFNDAAIKARGREKPFVNMIDQPDFQGWTPFHWATYTGRLDVMRRLLERLANPFLITNMKRNALHQAAESKRPDVMEFVLNIPERQGEEWFDINKQDNYGETPLHVAVEGSAGCVDLLLRKGARRDIRREGDGSVPLHLAYLAKAMDKVTVVDLLSSDRGLHVNALDERGRTPLFTLLNSPGSVSLLLERGADVSKLDKDGRSVLHYSCIEGESETLKLLLEAAPPELAVAKDSHGDTPLAHAFECMHGACAQLLLEARAFGDLNDRLKNKDGLSLVHRAAKLGDADMLEWCFKDETYTQGVLTRNGRTVKEVAAAASKLKIARIAELINHYESWSTPSPRRGEVTSMIEAQTTYFAVMR